MIGKTLEKPNQLERRIYVICTSLIVFGFVRYVVGLVGIPPREKRHETYELTGSTGTIQGYGYGTKMDA